FTVDRVQVRQKQLIFNYSLEELKKVIMPMALNGQEPLGSMGNDEALAVLSEKPQLLYNYFKQHFAQVTNPPIDPYRENLVMSLMSFIGREKNLLTETPEHCHQLKLLHPILSNDDMKRLQNSAVPDLRNAVIPMLFAADDKAESLAEAVTELCQRAEEKVDAGYSILILSDRRVSADRAPIPALLATAAVHNHLIKKKKRQLTGLILETGEARDVMHFATLLGYGASGINPYLAFESVVNLQNEKRLGQSISAEKAIENYITAVKKGLLKIMSKMGISTLRSYRGAQIFEAVGLKQQFAVKYFPGTRTTIEGVGIDVIAKESRMRHNTAFAKINRHNLNLDSGGKIHFRQKGEKHLLSPEAVLWLQQAVKDNDYEKYKQYADIINNNVQNRCTIRRLFKFKAGKPVAVAEVEPESAIIKRFVVSAMSFGSISKEAHETVAVAMNRLGAASNSGEGGEDEQRYKTMPSGDSKRSAVKQIASARFGVNSNYITNSVELQIKMAQGAKPGEGGQLPGHKVDKIIADIRHSTPGVGLISPPPHHDIYSIEDLAQLIYDLKTGNPQARVSVKLVSKSGVGTIAAGVAKGKADMILISGHDGGTGSSPLSSIKYAGIPWEMGLAETQQTLVLNHLRDRVRLQVDGQLRTGRDIVIGALLGAEEFGFGSIALITLGCVMMRKCHNNTCPVGIATQDPGLRKYFKGKPEYLINFMHFLARDVRYLLAELGYTKLDQLIGRSSHLSLDKKLLNWKSKGINVSSMLTDVSAKGPGRYKAGQVSPAAVSLDAELVEKSRQAVNNKASVSLFATIHNYNRTVGAGLSCAVSRKYGAGGMPDNSIHCKFTGSAGQSFGAFLAPGITFELEGDTNDYLGKCLSGGKLAVYPPKDTTFRSQKNIISGNVSLFGATGGELYLCGMAGERFAVRNSGATAVVEGVGDHCCEYMTGGRVVVLGSTGINFAAGMSGGIAYVLDEDHLFDTRCNLEMVEIESLSEADQTQLCGLIKKHIKYTDSKYAKKIINNWAEMQTDFVKVMPIDYKNALFKMRQRELEESDSSNMTEEVYS
ncbi:MAG TPA: glutamate synthase large subunit, partial [Spirochaetota bacterium]|nr:glutamate synthase large subunit [Spirochaetota bacterium]